MAEVIPTFSTQIRSLKAGARSYRSLVDLVPRVVDALTGRLRLFYRPGEGCYPPPFCILTVLWSWRRRLFDALLRVPFRGFRQDTCTEFKTLPEQRSAREAHQLAFASCKHRSWRAQPDLSQSRSSLLNRADASHTYPKSLVGAMLHQVCHMLRRVSKILSHSRPQNPYLGQLLQML